ncbi:MAG: hypothetical protein KGN74_04590 [Gemmatimonadota bacterium]|nr:hypothetical protein [Gemmatimonadota bacterium]MDE3172329.1 hypothetical protein [Gemmatimonadota bacterium]MDE3216456.1 hypothetical protein [Gemmatimonadota bacterium]
MDWPYLHVTINHFPIILSVVGTFVLILALVAKRRGLWLYALATLTLAGLSAYPADFTGDEASHAVRDSWWVVRSAVHEHDQAASFALAALLIVGAVSAYGWWRMLRKETAGVPPKWLQWTVTLLAVWSLSVVVRTAYLGGKILHDNPNIVNPPPGFVAPPNPRTPPR